MRVAWDRDELMTVAVVRQLRDGDVAFIGLGTGGRAYALAVGIPTVACLAAQNLHAPNLSIMLGPIINPDFREMPSSYTDRDLIMWPADAQIPVNECLDAFKRGKISVSFVSGAQVDRYGNLNIVRIEGEKSVRLVGCIAQTDHLAHAGRNILMMDITSRAFVPQVSFVSGRGRQHRDGLKGGGPAVVVTNLGLLSFHPREGHMQIQAPFLGVAVEEIQARVGFDLPLAEDWAPFPDPSVEELSAIRAVDHYERFISGQVQ